MSRITIKRLQDRIADARHDIESIGIHIAEHNESSISPEQILGLRGLQEMYRKRIVKLDEKIASIPLSIKDGSGGSDGCAQQSCQESSEITPLVGLKAEPGSKVERSSKVERL
jgi:hypothetical protein